MATVLIVAPVFALIAAGYASVLFHFVSEGAHKGISEFAFTPITARSPSFGSRRSRSRPCCASGARTARTASCSQSARSTATS